MTFAAIGSAIWRFLKGLPWQVWAVVLAALTGYYIDQRARGQQRQKDRADERERSLEEQRRIDEAIRQQTQENQDARERADQTASDVPVVRRTDELRERSPRDAEILLDPARSSGQ